MKADDYLVIEKSLAKKLNATWTAFATKVAGTVSKLIANGKYDDAEQYVAGLDTSEIFLKNKAYIKAMTYAAMYHGASSLTPALDQTAVHTGKFEEIVAKQLKLFEKSIVINMLVQLQDSLLLVVGAARTADPTTNYGPNEVHQVAVVKSSSVLRDFASFKETGDSMLQLIAQLHTSRLSAFGFTMEAEVLGIAEYAVSEQLDNRICPVCQQMHGKVYSVKEAARSLDKLMSVENPDDLKTLQAWPSRDQDQVASLKVMTNEQMYARNWHIPPYHPGCRGILVPADKVPSIKDTPSYRAALGVGGQDFVLVKELAERFGISPEMMDQWNKVAKFDPRVLLSYLMGVPKSKIGTVLAAGTGGVSLTEAKVAAFAASALGDVELVYDTTTRVLTVTALAGSTEAQMLRVYAVAEEIGATEVVVSEEVVASWKGATTSMPMEALKKLLQKVTAMPK